MLGGLGLFPVTKGWAQQKAAEARQQIVGIWTLVSSVNTAKDGTVTKGISFGTLSRGPGGTWDTSRVEGLPYPSLYSNEGATPPDLYVRPFHQAGNVFVMDIYAASEKPIEGVTAEALAERARAFGHRSVDYVGSMEKGIDAIVQSAGEGDLVLTLGAGSVSQAGERILKALREGH